MEETEADNRQKAHGPVYHRQIRHVPSFRWEFRQDLAAGFDILLSATCGDLVLGRREDQREDEGIDLRLASRTGRNSARLREWVGSLTHLAKSLRGCKENSCGHHESSAPGLVDSF